MSTKKILVTGSSGFIGYHLSSYFCEKEIAVVGVDNHNSYYDPILKEDRLAKLRKHNNFTFYHVDISNKKILDEIFEIEKPDIVINLAAQAGVRYSIENPYAYVESNLVGFMNVLEACRTYPVKHLLYASSSSVYGGNQKTPFSTDDNVDHPVSLYAATKKSNELLAHSYSHLYNIPTTGLRFFTVYGPFGRPDMAYFSFTKNIFEEKEINVFNEGKMRRDFTYIDDVVESIFRLIDCVPESNPNWIEDIGISSSFAPYKIYNIGNSEPETLLDFIETIEDKVGKKANKKFVGMQDGDVKQTFADTSDLERTINFKPQTTLSDGIESFVNWYKEYYKEDEKI